ncbi:MULTISPECIES: glucan ABC transporter ATP-binding protein/ permease [Phyllobacterium]|uniref:Cyclic beta-1,2-glucan ABC transporter n=1 Tax=Phyllobacterium sophorae TaxID=1520277 RepID=A0A2P7BIT9_9HYPH|nr:MULTISPECIES: glucan ABC transporter ATP-binding protein/ permease [Phyllobacterium]PSH66384.1 cyclic beta-1,2-glucan ABC transporter [Phyllobacterium sophorae]UXN64070.1 glucan ABC transporter ATP-binding protein/ permease [Phyllobacterium sp. A18/5-2]
MSLLNIYWKSLQYLGAEKRATVFICVVNIALALTMLFEPLLMGLVIQAIADKADIWVPLTQLAAVGLFHIGANVLVAREADRLAHRRKLAVLTESYNRVISMPLSWHHQRGTSNAMHTLLRAIETLFGLWLEFMRTHLATTVALVGLIPMAVAQDWRLASVLAVLGVVYVLVSRFVTAKTKDGQAQVERHHITAFSHVTDSMGNISVLQSYNRIDEETRALQSYAKQLLAAQYPVLNWWALAAGINRMASTISILVVLALGAHFVMQGQMLVGQVVSFIGFAGLLIGRLDQLSAFVNQIFAARAKLEDFFDMEASAAYAVEPKTVHDIDNVSGDVEFKNVSFEFANSTQGLKNVSFKAKAGQTVAIVGPTGAGKTTLINLLQRVYDPKEGRILVDDIDTRTISRRSLRNAIATVFQDAGMFNRSIEDNIRIGRPKASAEDVLAAAEAADASDFILAKSGGYGTVVGERGSQLSGGERQRVAIARAILKDAPILVLDEATSALDVETEARVKVAVDKLCQNRTTFIIAHRLSTVRDADIVLFMDQGEVIESGSFDELARQNGRFTSLLKAGGLKLDDDTANVTPFPRKPEAA